MKSVLPTVCVAVCSLLAACSSDEPGPNREPIVELTEGPVEGDTVLYRITLAWSGEDADGSIARYEVAVDPPSAFTEEEIAEGGPGIEEEFVPGEGGSPDVTRMTKVVDGLLVSFDWVHTVETSREFRFSTPHAESTLADGNQVPTGRFHGMHAVYVRAVDDRGARSTPDKTAFTSTTVAPRSVIIRPRQGEEVLTLGPALHAAWEGRDTDAPGRKPAGYLYAIAEIPFSIILPFYFPPPEEILESGWIYRDADSLSVTLDLAVPDQYAFGVRAVDENGVVEPFLDWGRNAIRFQAVLNGAKPRLTIAYEGSTWSFPSPTGSVELEVPGRRELQFLLACSAEEYGETCDGFRWGLDIVDLDSGEGWTPWTTDPEIVLPPLPAGVHVLYVEARDALGAATRATLVLHVVEFPFDREVLLVDDSFDDTFPRDAEQDAFWRDLVSYYTAESGIPEEQFFTFEVFGPGDRGTLDPTVPALSDLSRYKLIVWECRGSGYNAQTALVEAVGQSTILASYLKNGGKLWLGGRMTVGAMDPAWNGDYADLQYPKEDLGPGEFAWDIMKLRSTKIINDKGAGRQNLMNRANPFPPAPVYDRQGGVVPDLPLDTLVVDLSKLSLGQRAYGGFSHADAISDPILAEAEPGFRGDIDSLYVYGSAGVEFQDRASSFHNKLCALRWHDPDPAREHGRIQWFGFSMYYMVTEQAQRVFTKSVDWFREESPLAP